ncbi:MYLK [Mytilus coruscus]|uniref:MYLK n=1 Tax=Mytilus coruscus TaxID=42192 RepID=A0A6J8CCN5_MYTCO|nr:MYLK [Mytilus coruscus]
MDRTVVCNKSSSVQIVCIGYGDNVSYSSWIHSYNDQFIRNISGEQQNNRSTLAINNCKFEDLGTYTCTAWYEVDNETYWSNVKTYLTVYGPPIAGRIKTTMKPTVLSIAFYSSIQPTEIQWYENKMLINNVQGFYLQTFEQNFTVHMHGIPVIVQGFITNLTLDDTKSGEYSVLLNNGYGEYNHKFQLSEGIYYTHYLLCFNIKITKTG